MVIFVSIFLTLFVGQISTLDFIINIFEIFLSTNFTRDNFPKKHFTQGSISRNITIADEITYFYFRKGSSPNITSNINSFMT